MDNFSKVSKCDMCSWVGMNRDKGPHFIKSHLKLVDKMIIQACSAEGVSIEKIMQRTGFDRDRVRNRLKQLNKLGRLVFDPVRSKAYTLSSSMECATCHKVKKITDFSYRNIRANKRHKSCKVCRNTSQNHSRSIVKELKVQETSQPEFAGLAEQFVQKIYKKADNILRERYRAEYDALVKEQIVELFANIS